MRSHPISGASINGKRSLTIPSIDGRNAVDQLPVTHLEDSIMDAIVCQAAEIIASDAQAEEKIVTLTSTEMSFVGGGLMLVDFS
jgi:hypothetical protein